MYLSLFLPPFILLSLTQPPILSIPRLFFQTMYRQSPHRPVGPGPHGCYPTRIKRMSLCEPSPNMVIDNHAVYYYYTPAIYVHPNPVYYAPQQSYHHPPAAEPKGVKPYQRRAPTMAPIVEEQQLQQHQGRNSYNHTGPQSMHCCPCHHHEPHMNPPPPPKLPIYRAKPRPMSPHHQPQNAPPPRHTRRFSHTSSVASSSATSSSAQSFSSSSVVLDPPSITPRPSTSTPHKSFSAAKKWISSSVRRLSLSHRKFP